MKDKEQFLKENEEAIRVFKTEYYKMLGAIKHKPKKLNRTVFNYWKYNILFNENSDVKTDWEGVEQLFNILELPLNYRITEQQYYSIINQ